MKALALTTFAFLAFLAIAATPSISAQRASKERKKEPLPKTDEKAKELLSTVWKKVDSITTLEENALKKIAAHSTSEVDFSDVPDGYRVSSRAKKAVQGVTVEAKVAWVAHEEHFSMHVLDSKNENGDKETRKRGWGIGRAVGNAQIKIGFALPYLMGLRDFDTEFKDHTFTFDEAPHKEWKVIKAWYHLLGKKFAKTYYIDGKGKGYIRHLINRGRIYSLKLEKAKKKQMIITGLEIAPEKEGLERIIFDPKKAKKAAKEEKKKEFPYEPRFDDKIEWYGFGKREVVVGKKTKMALTVTTWVDYERRRIPVSTKLKEVATNDKATDEMIKAAGFGKRAGGLPPPTYRGQDKPKEDEKKASEGEEKKAD